MNSLRPAAKTLKEPCFQCRLSQGLSGMLELREALAALYEDVSDELKVRQCADNALAVVDQRRAEFRRLQKNLD